LTKSPVALTITSGTGPKLRPVNDPNAPEAEAPAQVPLQSRFGERAVARAELGATYAAVLGQEVMPRDILEAMMASERNDEQPQPEALAEGLAAVGLLTEVESVAHCMADHWPALAQMTSGQFVLVLAQQGQDMVIYDTTCTDNRAYVPLSEFEPVFHRDFGAGRGADTDDFQGPHRGGRPGALVLGAVRGLPAADR